MDLFWRCIIVIFSSTIYFEGGDCGTVQTSASLNASIGSSVDLTCTYTLESGDSVVSGLIAWQAKKLGTPFYMYNYESIATFSPPGGGYNTFTTTESALILKDRTELLDVTSGGSNTYRVVLRVNEVQCLDEKEYQCSVTFININTAPQTKTAVTSLTVQAPAQQPYDIPAPDRSNIEENTTFILSCTANVGKPPGKIKWWRYRDRIYAPLLMAESSEIPTVQPRVCVYNVTFSIQPLVTKDDDQSVWKCSVDNELLTSSPDQDKPNQETARINVYYKVGVPKITKSPDTTNSQYYVGSSVTLTCVANGYPNPSTNNDINKYVWTFKANPGGNETELSSNNGVLSLSNLQETDTGTYTCTAFNGFNGKVFNSSFEQELKIDYLSQIKHDNKHHFRSSGSGILRTSGEAAKQYSNLKQRAKGKLSESKRPKTGGGPKPPSLTPVELSILEQLEGRPSLEGICGGIDTADPVETQPSTSSSASSDVPAKKKDVQDSGKRKRKLTIQELEERNLSLENDKLQEEIEKLTSTSASTEWSTENLVTKDQQGGGHSGTVHTSASVKATVGSSVDLTCKYTLGPDDSVYSGFISWQAKISGSRGYENIAMFSPIGGGHNYFTTSASAMNLRNRAELLDIISTGSNTFRVVLRVKAVQHLDEKDYRCSVTFISPTTGPRTETAETFLTVQENHVAGRTTRSVSRGINIKFHLFVNPRIFHSKAKNAGSSNL